MPRPPLPLVKYLHIRKKKTRAKSKKVFCPYSEALRWLTRTLCVGDGEFARAEAPLAGSRLALVLGPSVGSVLPRSRRAERPRANPAGPSIPPQLRVWDPGLDASTLPLGSPEDPQLLNVTGICSFLAPLEVRLEVSHAWECWP